MLDKFADKGELTAWMTINYQFQNTLTLQYLLFLYGHVIYCYMKLGLPLLCYNFLASPYSLCVYIGHVNLYVMVEQGVKTPLEFII